ncbi:MAG TPA: DUF4118 domain-containing protein, partial [Thermomicrobiales bacterium]|nr:DUF4118 domain-containing protein [Thermomicrobiales bacterium]
MILRPIARPQLRERAVRSLDALDRFQHRLKPSLLSFPRFRRIGLPSVSAVTDRSWSLLVGVGCVLVPAVLMGTLLPTLPVTTPGVVLLLAVAFSAYLADWAGGVTALVLASLALDVFFVGDRIHMSLPNDAAEGTGFLITLLSGAVLIWLIERVKRQSVEDRRAALAARSAATALASLETVA